MPRLLILRHAKAASPPATKDIDRPLTPDGRAAATKIGEFLHGEGLVPDLGLVSPSRRTRETWDLMQPSLGEVAAEFDGRIYAAPAPHLLAILQQVASPAATVLLVGHNPGCEDLAQMLVRSGDGEALVAMRQKYPPAALAVIAFDGDGWSELASGEGRLERFVTPAALGACEDS